MKRSWVLTALFVFLFGFQLLVTCSNPLERDDGPDPVPPRIDTVIEFDTILFVDTVGSADTLIIFDTTAITDTLTITDTITTIDSILVVDTLVQLDTVALVDTVTSTDTLTIYDTTTITDTLTVTDTITTIDSILVVDTLVQLDTVMLVDTVTSVDTLTVTDTLFEVDTLLEIDTLIVLDTIVVHDTTGIQTVCSELSRNLNEIIWGLRNTAGVYHLVFEAMVEGDQPPKTLTVTIDGQEYEWSVEQSLLFELETTLVENASVRIVPSQPLSLGHSVDVCLTLGTQ